MQEMLLNGAYCGYVGGLRRADAYEVAKQFGWGQKRTDELLRLALAEERVNREVAAHGEHVYTVRK